MVGRARWILPMTLTAALVAVPPLAGSQARSPVIQLLLSSRDVRTRMQAATTLGRLRPPGAREALESALSDDNAAVRAASAEALLALGDAAALGALRSHANDRDPGVRAGITRAVQQLEQQLAATSGGGGGGSAAVAPSGDWERARYVLHIGTLANRAGGRPTVTEVLRNAIVREVARNTEIACALGSPLPPEAERRVRAGRMRAYALEGSVNTLRRWTVATTMSVRAEVSLVLMTTPTRAIVGSLSGAATAQEHTPYYDAEAFAQRLEDRALAAAVRGALNNLQASLSSGRP